MMTQQMKNELEYYMTLHYAIVLIQDDDGSWFAKIPDLPGCMTFGDDSHEVLEMLDDAKVTWISGRLLAGDPIPEPQFA